MKENKCTSKRVVTEEGIFASKKEFNRWWELQILERNGYISNLKRQVPYVIISSNDKFEKCFYIADFEYNDKKGEKVVEDIKGHKTGQAYSLFQIKKKLMYAIHKIEIQER